MIGKVGLIDAVPRQDERSLLAVGRCRVLGEEVATIEALDRFNPLEETRLIAIGRRMAKIAAFAQGIPHG